jgi:predicted PurR-regulated permease PerM
LDEERRGHREPGERETSGATRRPRDGFAAGALALKTVIVVLVVLAAMLLVLLAYLLRELLVLVFLAALLASALQVPAEFLEKRGLPRIVAIIIPYLLLGAFIVLFGLLVVPPLVVELAAFVQDLPELIEQARVWLSDLVDVEIIGSVEEDIREAVPSPEALLGVSLTAMGVLAGLAIIVVTSVLLLLERDKIRRWIHQFIEPESRESFDEVSVKALAKLGAYVRGQLLIMLIVGAGTATAMLILGVPFALAMGVLTFLLEAIPNFGPILAGIPVVLLGLSQSFTTALILLGWLLVLQALESWLLTPLIQHKALDISPLVIFLAVLGGFALFGVVGAIVAVPLVGAIEVILHDVVIPMRKRQMGTAPPADSPDRGQLRAPGDTSGGGSGEEA